MNKDLNKENMENLSKVTGGNIPTDHPVKAMATHKCPVYEKENINSRIIHTFPAGAIFTIYDRAVITTGGRTWTFAESPAGIGAVLNENFKRV